MNNLLIWKMRNGEVFSFSERTLETLGNFNTTEMGIEKLEDSVKNAHALMDTAMIKPRSLFATPAVQEGYSKSRDAVSALRFYVMAHRAHEDAAIQEAVIRLERHLKTYCSKLHREPMAVVSANISNFLQEATADTDLVNAITTLGAETWLANLQKHHTAFKSAQSERVDESALRPKVKTEEAREAVDKALTKLYTFVGIMDDGDATSDFAQLNSKLQRIAEEARLSTAKRSSTPTPAEDAPAPATPTEEEAPVAEVPEISTV